jgi:hypothetical protein
MSNHLMLDLETLSTRNDAVVVAIGVAIFNDEHVIDTKHWPLTLLDLNGHVAGDTLAWWFQQSKEAQQVTFGGDRVAPAQAAYELCELMIKHQPVDVWANDPHFDVTILQSWWERNRLRSPSFPGHSYQQPVIVQVWPFKYNQPRSYRTILEMARELGFTDEMKTKAMGMYIAHSAVEDAATQARVVIAAKQFIANHNPIPHQGDWRKAQAGAVYDRGPGC